MAGWQCRNWTAVIHKNCRPVLQLVPIQALGRHVVRWSAASLVVVVPAGLMMFSAHPHEFINNRVFQIKLLLIVIAGLNAWLCFIPAYIDLLRPPAGLYLNPADFFICAYYLRDHQGAGMFRLMLKWVLIVSFTGPAAAVGRSDTEALWSSLRAGGYIVLMRHAQTEAGIGDPPGFKIGDCRMQRNLSAAGRRDAKRIGEAFRIHGIAVAAVLSSQWCRCLDTAMLAFGRAEPTPMLNSMFNDEDQAQQSKIKALYRFVARRENRGNLVMVTHAANIQALTGVSPASGELVVVLPDGTDKLKVIGRLHMPGT